MFHPGKFGANRKFMRRFYLVRKNGGWAEGAEGCYGTIGRIWVARRDKTTKLILVKLFPSFFSSMALIKLAAYYVAQCISPLPPLSLPPSPRCSPSSTVGDVPTPLPLCSFIFAIFSSLEYAMFTFNHSTLESIELAPRIMMKRQERTIRTKMKFWENALSSGSKNKGIELIPPSS